MKTITKETLKFIFKENIAAAICMYAQDNSEPKSVKINGTWYELVDPPKLEEPKKLTLEEIIEKTRLERTNERHWSLWDQRNALWDLHYIADYLNGNWKPDYEDNVWGVSFDISDNGELFIDCHNQYGTVLFKNKALAKEALEILGQEKIKTALGCYLKP